MFNKEQSIYAAELSRVDSLLALEKDKKSVYAQTLFARKADVKVQQAQSEEKYKRYYDVQKIIGFRETLLNFEPESTFDLMNVLKWLFGGLVIELLIILTVDKNVKEKLSKMTS